MLIDLGYDDILDDNVLTNNISQITRLDFQVNGTNINDVSDLTGLEDFVNLTILDIRGPNTTSFTLPQTPTKLNSLSIAYCDNLNSLILNSTSLEGISIYGQTSLNTINTSNLPNLNRFYDSQISTVSGITSLDFSNNPKMYEISIHNSTINSLNISNCTLLNQLLAHNTPLSGVLDISNILITADVRINGTNITCLKVNAEQLAKKDEFLASNSGGSGGTVGMWRLNNATVSTTCP